MCNLVMPSQLVSYSPKEVRCLPLGRSFTQTYPCDTPVCNILHRVARHPPRTTPKSIAILLLQLSHNISRTLKSTSIIGLAKSEVSGSQKREDKEEVKRGKGVREGTRPEGERGGKNEGKKSERKRGPKAHSKNSDFGTPMI